MTFLGVDGCSSGWFVAVREGEDLRTARYDDVATLWDAHRGADRVLIDVPIGLTDEGRRPCDAAAKDRLGCRGGSVFYAPCRSVVELANRDPGAAHAEASETQRETIGHGLSQQAWNITPKIAEVDAFLREEAPGVVRESHPELCFYALADGSPVAYSKATERGRAVRMELLASALPGVEEIYRRALADHRRSEVKRDDVLDALVLAAVADRDLVSVPADSAEKTEDETGREMRIHHPPTRWENGSIGTWAE